ncbi:HAD-IA family hydrolase, partial [bacterium]|nr:HAD-IA family hydrolase [bacterium]
INKSLVNWIRKKRQKYTICLLTNNTIVLERLLKERFKIYSDFDVVFNSATIGISKPDPKLFKYMLKKIKAKSKECLFIDDNPGNVKTAKKLGFNTILFTTNKDFFKKVSMFNL